MLHVSADSLPWIEKGSALGKSHSFCRDISLALGGKANLGPRFGGHPFDVQIRRVPAGAAATLFHVHFAHSEFFLVQSGTGALRVGFGAKDNSGQNEQREQHVPLKPGDFFFHPPGEAHQIFADGTGELVYLVVTDNPDLDVGFYPDTSEWFLLSSGVVRKFSGERDFASEQARLLTNVTPFSTRFRNLADVPWDEYASPKGKFRGASKELSIALGAKRNTAAGLGGHTFDVEYGKYEARQCGCPYHSHTAQTELYLILDGAATMRSPVGLTQLRAGDAAICLPHEAHQLRNDSDAPMHYLCIADNPLADSWHYPDTGKYGHREPRKIFFATDIGYWDGEE